MKRKRISLKQIVPILHCRQAGMRRTTESDPRFQDIVRRMNFPP
jgi:hypothetical protein